MLNFLRKGFLVRPVGRRRWQTLCNSSALLLPSLLLKMQPEVCNLSFANCWKEAAFSLLETAPGLLGLL